MSEDQSNDNPDDIIERQEEAQPESKQEKPNRQAANHQPARQVTEQWPPNQQPTGQWIPNQQPVQQSELASLTKVILKISGGVLIASAILFAAVSILAVWGVIEDGKVIWRSFSTIGVLGFTSLVILIASNIIDAKK